MKTAIIGGGAAGFFLAINLKEMMPTMQVDIFERSHRVLAKVEVSGGGRCNCTNSFEGIRDLSAVYPRGHRLMKRLFNVFNHQDAYRWFESHGVPLTIQDDHCVFPAAQDSHAIIDCFLREARRRVDETAGGVDASAVPVQVVMGDDQEFHFAEMDRYLTRLPCTSNRTLYGIVSNSGFSVMMKYKYM